MRIVFAGTPEFAAIALDAILNAGHHVHAVYTQPDRNAGRGMRLSASPVKARAAMQGIPIFQPASLRDPSAQEELAASFGKGGADIMVVAAYGLLLPPEVLAMPRLGCINIHASLLPRWRGAAPVERAILAGDTETGISIMQMDAGLDTGPVLHKIATAIDARERGGSLREALGKLGAEAVLEVLARLERGDRITAVPQTEAGVSYAKKIDKAEGRLDFAQGAPELDRKIRAFDPAPGAFTFFAGATIKIWSARPGRTQGADALSVLPPGTVRSVTAGVLEIACGADGRDSLLVEELQKPGGKRLATAQFLAGTPMGAGGRFASSD